MINVSNCYKIGSRDQGRAADRHEAIEIFIQMCYVLQEKAIINSFFGGQSIFSIEQIHRDVIGFWNVMVFCMVEVLRLSCKIFFKVILFFCVLFFAHFFIEWFGTNGHFNGFRNSDFLGR